MIPVPNEFLNNVERIVEPHSNEHRQFICLDRNERVEPLPKEFMDGVRERLNDKLLMSYPNEDVLLKKISNYLGISIDQILLAAGSDAAIKSIFHVFVGKEDRVLMLEPSYAMYKVYSQIFGGVIDNVNLDRSLSFDAEKFIKLVNQDTKLVILANPNQPTGTIVDNNFIEELLCQCCKVGALLVIDEAYYPFYDKTILNESFEDKDNLLVVRTFSKAWGLAGLRIGYVCSSVANINSLKKVRSTHEVNNLAIVCASMLIDHFSIMTDYVKTVKAGCEVLKNSIESLGLTYLPCYGNFILIRVGNMCEPDILQRELKKMGYLVKAGFESECINDCIRVTLAGPEIMSEFSKSLKKAVKYAQR